MENRNLKKNNYIYLIKNNITNKCYVGQRTTNKPIEKDKYFGSGVLLKKSIKKHGKINFVKIILEVCFFEDLNKREEFWISKLKTLKPNGYNSEITGRGGLTGKKHKEESIEKMKITWALKKEEGFVSPNKGVKFSNEHKANISNSKLGAKNPNYNKSTWNKGLSFNEEVRCKISYSNKKSGRFKFDKNPKFKEIDELILDDILNLIESGTSKSEIYKKHKIQEQRYLRHLFRKGKITIEKMPQYMKNFYLKFT
jgi:group I intron endonuclease